MQNTYTENRYQRLSELELEFLKRYYCFGNLDILSRILKRSVKALRSTLHRYDISYNRGQRSLSEDELRAIWERANYRVHNPMIKDIPSEAVCAVEPEMETKPQPEAEPEPKPVQEQPSVCPCHVDDTIIAKRINLTDGGELWVCARCGRQIALRRGTFAANMNK